MNVKTLELRGAELDLDRIPGGSIRDIMEELLAPPARPTAPAATVAAPPPPERRKKERLRLKRGRHFAPACRGGRR